MNKKELEHNIEQLAGCYLRLSKRVLVLENDLTTLEWGKSSEKAKRVTGYMVKKLGKLIPTITTNNIPKVKVRW